MKSTFFKGLILLSAMLLATSCSKKEDSKTTAENKEISKQDTTSSKKEAESKADSALTSNLNKALDKTEVILADPKGVYFKELGKKWEVDEFNFSVYEMAYDAKKGILVGMNKKQTLIKAVNIKTGKVLWTRNIDLKKPEKLEEPEVEDAIIPDTENSRDNSTPAFIFDGDKTIIIATNKRNKKKKWEYDLKYYGVDMRNGRIKWRKTLVRGSKNMPYPGSWLQYGWTLWNQKDVIYLGEPEKGPIYILDPRNGEWYDIQYPFDTSIEYSFAGTGKDSTYFFKYGTNSEFTLKAVDKLDGSDDTKYAWEKIYPCRIKKAFFLGKEIDSQSTFLCSRMPEKKGAYKYLDALIKFDPKSGEPVWEAILDDRVPNANIKRDMIYSLESRDKKHIYVRSLFYIAKVDAKDGKVVWKHKLNIEKVNGIFVDNQFFRHEWVLGGDEAYDDYFMLNPKDGSKLWTSAVTKTKKNKNPGMPANASIDGDWILSYGDNVIKILDKKTGKMIWKTRTKDKIESLYLSNGVFYLETQGVRKGYKLPNFELWSHSRTKSETLLNNGWMDKLGAELLLHNEDDFSLARMKKLTASMKTTLKPKQKVKAKVLTNQARFSSLVFSDDGKHLYFSTNDKDPKRTSKINVETKKIEPLGDFEEFGYQITRKSAVKELTVKDGKKKKKKVNQYYLKAKDGKEVLLSDNELEYHTFNKEKTKLFLVIADNQYFYEEVDYKDLIFKVYDIKENKFYTFYTLKETVGVIRKSIRESIVRHGGFVGKDRVAFTIENMHGHKGFYVMKYDVKKPVVVSVKISEDDEIESLGFPKKMNLQPATGMEFQETDFNHSFYESLVVDPSGNIGLGENFGLKYGHLKKKGLKKFEHLVTTYAWSPDGSFLALNSGGNVYLLNSKTGKATQVTWFLPKREPKNFDDTKTGNKFRILSLAFSPKGETLALVIKMPNETLRRIVLIENIKKYMK